MNGIASALQIGIEIGRIMMGTRLAVGEDMRGKVTLAFRSLLFSLSFCSSFLPLNARFPRLW